MMMPPCKDCPDRHEACWGSCDKYKAWIDARHAGTEDARKFSTADGFRKDNMDKRKKHFRR